jgi:hypothetical protein
MRGGSSVTGVVSPVNVDILSGMGGGGDESDDLSPAVLLLNLDGRGGAGFQDTVLSLFPRLPMVDVLIILFRAVRSSTFFSVKGKYSAKWVVMSSLGGRWPKKFLNFDGLFVGDGLPPGLFRPADVVGDGGGSSAFSGCGTPRPLKILTELARFVFAGVCASAKDMACLGDNKFPSESGSPVGRTTGEVGLFAR